MPRSKEWTTEYEVVTETGKYIVNSNGEIVEKYTNGEQVYNARRKSKEERQKFKLAGLWFYREDYRAIIAWRDVSSLYIDSLNEEFPEKEFFVIEGQEGELEYLQSKIEAIN